MHIKKGDTVVVIAGDDAGTKNSPKIGRVLRVIPEENKLVVEGINRVYKHLRPSRRNPQGGRLSKEMPISVSNVMVLCPSCKRGVKVGHRYATDGTKQRFCKKCGGTLATLGKPRKAFAQK